MWRFNNLWGEEVEEVREYLKREWKKKMNTKDVDPCNKECLRLEANQILRVYYLNVIMLNSNILNMQWWWYQCYPHRGKDCTEDCDHYGNWLLGNYREAEKVNMLNSTVPGPRSISIEITCSVEK